MEQSLILLGTLPTSLCCMLLSSFFFAQILSLTNLMFSWLNNNQLSGTIPDSIGNLVELGQLYVPLSFCVSYQ